MFHVRCVCMHKLLYFSLCSVSFCVTFLSAGIATSLSMYVFPPFVFNNYTWLICRNFSICVLLDSVILSHLRDHIVTFVSLQCLVLCILNNVNAHRVLSCLIKYSFFFAKIGHSEVNVQLFFYIAGFYS